MIGNFNSVLELIMSCKSLFRGVGPNKHRGTDRSNVVDGAIAATTVARRDKEYGTEFGRQVLDQYIHPILVVFLRTAERNIDDVGNISLRIEESF